MSDEIVFLVALEQIPGIGSRGVKQLISYCGSASEVFSSPKNKLLKIPGLGERMVDVIHHAETRKVADQIIADAAKAGADILPITSQEYPRLLKEIPDSPNLLFKKGYGNLSPDRSVAVVGTRKATEYGKHLTAQLVEELAAMHVTIISGLAYGIDICAHQHSLKHDNPTIGVLAGGIDRIYPATHKKYAEEMQQNGAILTESIPGTNPDRHLFPARNRIIAGMAEATIVVEAAEKGGALITANLADSYNRIVFAVPGNVGSTYSEGTNRLIATQRAYIYTGAKDLMYHLGWDQQAEKANKVLPEMTDEEMTIYQLLKEHSAALEIDMIAVQAQLPINRVASVLLNLEFKNVVKSMPGKKFGLM